MSDWSIMNVAAWVLCGVVAFLLLGDFIKTEIKLAREAKAEKERDQDATEE